MWNWHSLFYSYTLSSLQCLLRFTSAAIWPGIFPVKVVNHRSYVFNGHRSVNYYFLNELRYFLSFKTFASSFKLSNWLMWRFLIIFLIPVETVARPHFPFSTLGICAFLSAFPIHHSRDLLRLLALWIFSIVSSFLSHGFLLLCSFFPFCYLLLNLLIFFLLLKVEAEIIDLRLCCLLI